MYFPSPPSQKPGTLAISLGENENYWLVSGPSVREQCATVLHFPQPPNPFHPNNSTSSILTLLLTNPYNPEKDSTLIPFLMDPFPIIPSSYLAICPPHQLGCRSIDAIFTVCGVDLDSRPASAPLRRRKTVSVITTHYPLPTNVVTPI